MAGRKKERSRIMNAHSWTEALGWTLLHSLWQGALLAGLYLPARHWLRGHSPQSRYLLAVLTLAAMLIISGITLSRLWPQETDIQLVATTQTALRTGPGELPAEAPLSLKGLLTTLTPWLSWGWMLGVGLLALKWAGGFYYSRRLRVHGTQLPDIALAEQVLRWQQRLGIRRRVQLRLSSRIGSPMTLGHLRPVILIPLSLASGLSPEQWEAILLHELAHIRRADYLVNLIHSLVEILFFYHPLCWYLSRQIHREREACCDDLAVESCGDALRYAESLIRLQHLRFTPQTSFAMNLIPSQGAFSQRIQRLFVPTQDRKRSPWAILLALLCVTCLLSQSWKAQAQSTSQIAAKGVEPFSITITRDFTLKQLDELKARFAEKGIRLETSITGVDAEGHLTAISIHVSLPDGSSGSLSTTNMGSVTISSSEDTPLSISGKPYDPFVTGLPLYLLDGKRITKEEADKLDPGQIATIDVLKGASATSVYGPKAKEGVIVIRTKTPVAAEKAIHEERSAELTKNWPSEGVTYVIDQKIETEAEVKALDVDQIVAVSVFGSDFGVNAYGEDGRNGIVMIETKAGHEEKTAASSTVTLPDSKVKVFPNPSSQNFTIQFTLSEERPVSIKVYDPATGKLVKVLAEQVYPAGIHTVEWQADNEVVGNYFIHTNLGGDEGYTHKVSVQP
ncbi:MAG: T9SS C-terminal target domain-containing protein [Bacteroidetes bacterium]|nr:MAG: T9SS C-terminal target domain-containing protein [Bacteroidota bacterium]